MDTARLLAEYTRPPSGVSGDKGLLAGELGEDVAGSSRGGELLPPPGVELVGLRPGVEPGRELPREDGDSKLKMPFGGAAPVAFVLMPDDLADAGPVRRLLVRASN